MEPKHTHNLQALLENIFEETFEENHKVLTETLISLGATKDDLRKNMIGYTLGMGDEKFPNENYRDSVMRLVLYFHFMVKDTYHIERQNIVCDFLGTIPAHNIVDIGYGTISPYMLSYLKKPGVKLTLVDQDPGAEEFSRLIMSKYAPELTSKVSYMLHDMNANRPPTNFDTFLMFDAIEHCKNPTTYLNDLITGNPDAYFIFALPICSVDGFENFHFIEWLTVADAESWLQAAGLEVISSKTITTNPDVDLFSHFVKGGFQNHLVLCKKT